MSENGQSSAEEVEGSCRHRSLHRSIHLVLLPSLPRLLCLHLAPSALSLQKKMAPSANHALPKPLKSQNLSNDPNRKPKRRRPRPRARPKDESERNDEQRQIDMREQLDEVDPYDGGEHTIFEVPSILLELHSGTFTPQVVSIGPYHSKKEHLKEMEKHKWRLLKHVASRTKVAVQVLLDAMSDLEEDTRNRYDKPVGGFAGQEFPKMMLLDACFILELLCVSFYGWNKCGYRSDPDPRAQFIPRGILPFIQRDLLMLENQLPLFVLDRLYALTWGSNAPDESVADLALEFFNSAIPGISENKLKYTRDELQGLHLLHIVRMSLKPALVDVRRFSCQAQSPNNIGQGKKQDQFEITIREEGHEDKKKAPDDELIATHSVTKLWGTGIKFEKKGSNKLLDIEFEKGGKLLIPTLQIQDSTKSIFLNLMAFELCYPYCTNYVTSYISFMDGLINSAKDVEHLHEKGIIVHGLGSDEDVAQLFNNLRQEIAFDPGNYYLSEVSRGLSRHYNQKWRSWTATLKNEYLKDPWKIISLVAAGLLIFLTAAQTVYTMLSYHHA